MEAGESRWGALQAGLLGLIEDAVIAVDAAFVVTTWSLGAERLYGWTAAEALQMDVSRVVRFEMSDEERAEMRARTAREGRTRRDAVAIRKDGTTVDVELINVAITGADGAVTGYLGIHRDVSERKRLEREHQRLAAIVEASSEFIGLAALDGQALFLNDAGQRLVGLDGMEQVWRTEVLDYFPREDRAMVRDEVLPIVLADGRWAGERFGETDIRLRHFETGAPIPVFWDCFRLDDPRTGEPYGLGAVVRDISERRRAQRRTETILESVTDAFYALDRDFRFTYLNARAVEVLAQLQGVPRTRGDFLGKVVWDEFPAAVRSPAYTAFLRAADEHRTVALEYQFPPDGGRWFETHVYPSEDGLSVYFRDITEAMSAAQERDDRARQQALVAELGQQALASEDVQSLMDEAVGLVARTLDVELAQVAERREGGDLVLVAGIGWDAWTVGLAGEPGGTASQAGYTLAAQEPVVSDDVATDARFRPSPLVRDHAVVSAVTVIIRGSEDPFGVLGALSTRPRAFSAYEVSFVQAVANVLATAVQRSEVEERLRGVREAERSRIARDLHDEALQHLTYALAQATRGKDAPSDLVPALRRVGEQLRGAIYDLRLGGEQHRPFTDLLRGLVEVHRAMVLDREFDIDLQDGTPTGPLGATGTEILRVLGEALTNARRHSGALHVVVRVTRSPTELRVEVADDGDGFDVAGSQAAAGTGLKGMRERAVLLGAHLDIVSAPSAGTTVALRLPLHSEDDRTAPVRILLVEDHAAVGEAIASAFEREAGFAIVGHATSLREARRMLEEVDVALIDLGLPDGNGGDLIAELRAASPRAQALVLSATVDRAEVARAVERGAAGVLNKAAHLSEVVEDVRRLQRGETLLSLDEIVELLRFAGREREREQAEHLAVAQLTPREREVLQALAEGLDTAEVAARLHITVRTARNHTANILAKLGVHSQLQALVFAVRYGVVSIS